MKRKIAPISKQLILMIFLILTVGCSTHRTVIPELHETPRQGMVLKTPIFVSLFDGRATKKNSEHIIGSLQNNLKQVYGNSIEFSDYFAKTPENRVTIRIRVMALGANFGSRIISTTAFANSIGTAQVNATDGWNTVVATASTQQSIFGGSFSGEGWWVGTAWIEMDVQDKRAGRSVSFMVPVAAEQRESNIWGYASGDKAAEQAWSKVSVHMMKILDNIFMKVRDEE